MWHKLRIPRASFVLWLVIPDRLNTKDKVASYDPSVDKMCLLCGYELEDMNHLFSACGFAQTLCRNLLLWVFLGMVDIGLINVESVVG